MTPTDTVDVESSMRRVLMEMTVLSEASGAKLGDVVHGGEPNNAPKGPRSSMADYYGRRWRRARGALSRAEVLAEAQDALINAKYAPMRSMLVGTLEWRLAIARDPRPARIVANVYGVSMTHVYYLRKTSRPQGKYDG